MKTSKLGGFSFVFGFGLRHQSRHGVGPEAESLQRRRFGMLKAV